MPQLPGGLTLAVWPVSFDPDGEILQIAEDAPADREDGKRFVRVLEIRTGGSNAWRGEWLHQFLRFTELDDLHLAAWNAWISSSKIHQFLDEVIAECARLAEVSRHGADEIVRATKNDPDEYHIAGTRRKLQTQWSVGCSRSSNFCGTRPKSRLGLS
jgi:hypothetical protein